MEFAYRINWCTRWRGHKFQAEVHCSSSLLSISKQLMPLVSKTMSCWSGKVLSWEQAPASVAQSSGTSPLGDSLCNVWKARTQAHWWAPIDRTTSSSTVLLEREGQVIAFALGALSSSGWLGPSFTRPALCEIDMSNLADWGALQPLPPRANASKTANY